MVLLPVRWYFTAAFRESIFVMLHSKACTAVMQMLGCSNAKATFFFCRCIAKPKVTIAPWSSAAVDRSSHSTERSRLILIQNPTYSFFQARLASFSKSRDLATTLLLRRTPQLLWRIDSPPFIHAT